MDTIRSPSLDEYLRIKDHNHIMKVNQYLSKIMGKLAKISLTSNLPTKSVKFFDVPTQVVLTDSSAQILTVYHHQNFGKRFLNAVALPKDDSVKYLKYLTSPLPTMSLIADFIKGFYDMVK